MLKDNIIALRSAGKTYSEIATELGCSKSTISYHIGEGQKEKTKARRIRSTPHPLQKKIFDFCRVDKGVLVKDEKFNLQDVLDKIGDNPRCYLTGDPIDIMRPETYSLDHIIPRSRGGKNTLENLGLATRKVNMSKYDMSIEEFVSMCKKVIANVDK